MSVGKLLLKLNAWQETIKEGVKFLRQKEWRMQKEKQKWETKDGPLNKAQDQLTCPHSFHIFQACVGLISINELLLKLSFSPLMVDLMEKVILKNKRWTSCHLVDILKHCNTVIYYNATFRNVQYFTVQKLAKAKRWGENVLRMQKRRRRISMICHTFSLQLYLNPQAGFNVFLSNLTRLLISMLKPTYKFKHRLQEKSITCHGTYPPPPGYKSRYRYVYLFIEECTLMCI